MGAPDEDRFARLVHEHAGAIGNYLRRRLYPLSPSDLDDLVEETMIVVWRRIDSVPAEKRSTKRQAFEESPLGLRSPARPGER
jgi:DNA-directed RNA polymerase specialized sigma24 family protein